MNEVVSIIDVAKYAGVAKSTVSNVLTGKKYVSPELRARVVCACKELDYHPNFYASALSSKKSNILALLLESSSDIVQKMYKNLIVSCVKEASEHGCSIIVYYNSQKEKLLETLRKGCAPIDGAIMMSPSLHDERLEQMDYQHTPLVVVGRPENTNCYNFVDVDNYALVRDIADKIIFLTGWENIYLVNSDEEMTISKDRYEGFADCAQRHGFDAKKRTFSREDFFAENSKEAYSIIQKNNSIIACDDIVAKRIYDLAQDKGLMVGEDFSIFSLGRSLDPGTFNPPLSYAKQDYSRIGKEAVKMLIRHIDDDKEKEFELIKSQIVIGKSVKMNNQA